MSEQRRTEWAYLLAILLPATALLVRFNVGDVAGNRPALILFVIPVTLCAYLGGLRPGVLCTLFSALISLFFLSEAFQATRNFSSLELVQWVTFIVAGGVISYLAERLHKSQERLRVDESRLSGMFNSAMDGIITVDEELSIVYINPAAEKMFGYKAAALVGTSARLLVPESHRRLCARLIRNLAVSGALNRFVDGPVEGVRADGSIFPVEATISKVDVQGIQHFTLVIRDVSERKIAEAALLEREGLYRTLFESLHEGVTLWDARGCIEACNPAAERILGWKANEFVGLHYTQIPWQPKGSGETEFDPEKLAVAIIQRTGTALLHRERALTRSDGKQIWIVQNGIPLHKCGEEGRPRVMITFTDITERRQYLETLSRMADIVSNSEDAIITKSLDGIIQSWNPAAEKMLGYVAHEAIGQPLSHLLMPAEEHAAERDVRQRILRGESIKLFETLFLHRDKRTLQIAATASPLRDASNAVTGVSIIARDVTQRAQAQRALQESEQRFRLMADTAPVLIWMSGPDNMGTYFNTSWLDFTGRALEQELGMGWSTGIHPDDLEACLNIHKTHFKQRSDFRMECRLRRLDGEYRWMLNIGQPRFNPGGEFVGFIGSCIDITDRRQAEQAMRERDAAEEASRLKSEFLATMSHELRTPLTGIIGFTEYMQAGQAGDINEEQAESLDSIHKSSLHLLNLINGILDLSKIEAGKMELQPETFWIREVIEEVCGVISPMAQKKRIQVQQHVAKDISTVTLDRSKFGQVLYNLLSNAVKFTDFEGKVTVDVTSVENRRLRLSVTDTGIGIDPKDVDKLFRNFHQLDNSITRRHEGTGLGLALTKKIVELQHGIITVESAPGKGSVFTVTLPY